MKIQASKTDIEQSHALLQLLEQMERLSKIDNIYSHPHVKFQWTFDSVRRIFEIEIGTFGKDEPATHAVDEAMRQIALIFNAKICEAASEAQDIIHALMPIPLEPDAPVF